MRVWWLHNWGGIVATLAFIWATIIVLIVAHNIVEGEEQYENEHNRKI